MKRKLTKACSSRGADMGRPNIIPGESVKTSPKLNMVKLDWSDWDYDKGGAYWGNSGGTNIYWAYNETIEIFVRASSREDAKMEVREFLPKARFFN